MPQDANQAGAEKDVRVPQDVGMNFTARDLRPHLSTEAKELVTEELLGPQQYQMGVVPKHLMRAGAEAGIMGGSSALFGAGNALSAAYDTGKRVLTAPARPDRLTEEAQKITDYLDTAGDANLPKEVTEQALGNAGQSMGRLFRATSNAVAPLADAYREYRYPASGAAETAARRVAKARRKRDRRQQSGLSLRDRFVRPFKEDARIGQKIRKQMDKGGPIQLNAPPKASEDGSKEPQNISN